MYVDDEPGNLVGFKATFRKDYDIITASSADEGLKILEENQDTAIIFCDHRMPHKTGVEFFEEISKKYPQPIRILLTGYVDIESVINAINQGHVFRYISKPWKEDEVRSTIEEGYKYYATHAILKIKNEELSKANEELDKFAYSVTHDIRGPIVSLIGALDIIKNSQDLDEIKGVAAMMEQTTDRINLFIENIHTYYNLKRGNLNITPIDFKKLIDNLHRFFAVNASMDNIEMKWEVFQQDSFKSDETILQIVINNLLSNAIKYQKKDSENKFVSTSVTVINDMATIIITDNGIGIEEKYLEDIFSMFFRATNQSNGSGFGLYNVKDALRKINGVIKVKSALNEGTEFIITIPGK